MTGIFRSTGFQLTGFCQHIRHQIFKTKVRICQLLGFEPQIATSHWSFHHKSIR